MENEEPTDLRARTFRLEGGEFLVMSFPLRRRSPAPRLTRAESAVVSALLSGASNRDIARGRARSVHTVAKQVASVYKKLGVCSRLELAARLADLPLGGGPWTG